MLKVGTKAPVFQVKLSNGDTLKLSENPAQNKSKFMVLYFYPKNETAVCTQQACVFRDHYQELRALNAEIYGISSDPADSHQSFKANHKLPFELILDEAGELRSLYEARMLFGFLPARVTYVIAPDRTVLLAYQNELSAAKHLEHVLNVLKKQVE